MAVTRKDKGNIEPLAGGVEFGLFQAVGRRQVFGLGFDQGNRDRLRPRVHLDTQDVIHPPPGAPPGEPVNDVNCRGGFFAADEVFCPSTGVDGGIDELGSRVRFAQSHRWVSNPHWAGSLAKRTNTRNGDRRPPHDYILPVDKENTGERRPIERGRGLPTPLSRFNEAEGSGGKGYRKRQTLSTRNPL